MRKTAARCVLLSCFSYVIFFGCSTGGNGREGSTTDSSAQTHELQRERRQLSEDLRRLRDEVDKEIKTISVRMEDKSGLRDASLRQRQEDLTDCRSQLEKSIDAVEKSSAQAWPRVQAEARSTLEQTTTIQKKNSVTESQ